MQTEVKSGAESRRILYAYRVVVHGAVVKNPGDPLIGLTKEAEETLVAAGQAGYVWPPEQPKHAA